MRFKVYDILSSALVLISCAGCSVKEDRGVCPCRLFLNFREVDTVSVQAVDLFVREDGEVLLEDVVHQDEFGEDHIVSVPRTRLQLCVWAGRGDTLSDSVSIPYGEGCPPVYIHSAEIDAACEMQYETIIMRKNFCRMTLNIKMSVQSFVGLSVSGNVNGYKSDGTPSSGDFNVRLYPENDRSFCISLPRQLDESLIMEIDTGDKVVRRFPLGHYIAESGYDWNAPDLEDITIDLDFAVTHLAMMIQGWEKEYKFDVVI